MITRENRTSDWWRRTDLVNVMKVYHHLARFLLLVPLLLYLSHNDEVELMATFTPADVISVVCRGTRRREKPGHLLGMSLVHQQR